MTLDPALVTFSDPLPAEWSDKVDDDGYPVGIRDNESALRHFEYALWLIQNADPGEWRDDIKAAIDEAEEFWPPARAALEAFDDGQAAEVTPGNASKDQPAPAIDRGKLLALADRLRSRRK